MVVGPLATGTGSIIRSDYVSGGHGNFEVVVLQGTDVVHYWHDNGNVNSAWHRGAVISTSATGLGPCSLWQSDFKAGDHGNFELVVQEANNLVHYYRDNSNADQAWHKAQVIAMGVSGPGAIIQSDFMSGDHGNFEVVVPQGSDLVHWFHNNSDVTLPWQQGQVVVVGGVTGPACLIQSDFKSGDHGNFEVVVQQGSNLAHFYHDNSDVNLPWKPGQIIATGITGPGAIIQSDFNAGGHGNFEVVVPQNSNLVHWFHNNSDVNLPWEQGQIVATGIAGPGAIIQSDFSSGDHGNFEVIVEAERASLQTGAVVAGGGGIDQNLVHYYHDNSDVTSGWQRAQVITYRGRSEKVCQLTGEFDRERLALTTNRTSSQFGLSSTDLGFPVDDGANIDFLFGDSRRPDPPPTPDPALSPESTPDDSFGYSSDTLAPTENECIHLIFNQDPNPSDSPRFAPPVVTSGIEQGLFNVPSSGFTTPSGLYSFFWTGHCAFPSCAGTHDPNVNPLGQAVLARSNDHGLSFAQIAEVPPPFVYTASLNTDTLSNLPAAQQLGVFVYGVPCYRNSTPYLAYVPSGQVEDLSSWRYLMGVNGTTPSWGTSADEAVPVFDAGTEKLQGPLTCLDTHQQYVGGCIGEMSVTWNAPLQKWIMLYNCFDFAGAGTGGAKSEIEEGVRIRLADAPWGPWSDPAVLFTSDNVAGDHGWCHFMHQGGPASGCDDLGGDNDDLPGNPYGPYLLSRFSQMGFRRPDGAGTRIYYLMSTWNPYQVVVMSSDLFLPTLSSKALYARAGITLGDRTNIVLAGGGYAPIANEAGSVIVGNSVALGSVQSIGPIALGRNAAVNGSAESNGQISVGDGSQVSGGAVPFSAVTLPPEPVVSAAFGAGDAGGIHLKRDEVDALAPGSYGEVFLRSGARLELTSGSYVFSSLQVRAGAQIVLDQSAGAISIEVRDNFELRGEVIRSSEASAPFLIAYFGLQEVILENGLEGSLFVPNADLVLGAKAPTVFIGQYFAKTVTTRPNTTVVY
jgi:hypothetical protein